PPQSARRSTRSAASAAGLRCASWWHCPLAQHNRLGAAATPLKHALLPRFMEEIIDPARHISADPLDLHQVAGGRALDRLQGPEVVQQRALARRSDPQDFLQ